MPTAMPHGRQAVVLIVAFQLLRQIFPTSGASYTIPQKTAGSVFRLINRHGNYSDEL